MKIPCVFFLVEICLLLCVQGCGDKGKSKESKNEKAFLKPLQTQSDENNRYDFIYIVNHQNLQESKSIMLTYIDQIQIDTTVISGHTISFYNYDEITPADKNNLGSSKHDEFLLMEIHFDPKTYSIEIVVYQDEKVVNHLTIPYRIYKEQGLYKWAYEAFASFL